MNGFFFNSKHEKYIIILSLQTLKKFENLSKEIQNDAPTQPPLKCYTKGTPCISLYSESGDWCRAEIEKCHPEDENLVQVYFVDYGNKEYVDKQK